MIAQYPVKTIDLSILRRNISLIRSEIPAATKLLAVVKADAYGHGIVQVAHNALAAGADYLAVARTDEGLMLRSADIHAPILVLGASSELEIRDGVQQGLTLTVSGPRMIQAVEKWAVKTGRMGLIHLKIDTGMGRIGVRTKEEIQAVLAMLKLCPDVCLTGAFTHFADADGDTDEYTLMQLEKFRNLTEMLPEGVIRHCANSAAIHRYPEAAMDMVRVGISMYGYPPVQTKLPLKPVMSWQTAVTHVKNVEAGEKISYGCTFIASDKMKLATIACGYGDGYHRIASGKAEVLIRGQRCPIVGRICMDQMMADVSALEKVKPGDEVILIGESGSNSITADDLAAWCGTISYEVLLAATERVHCKWINDCNE